MSDNKKLIPVVRTLLPKILAEDIVGVQPMTNNVGEIFTLKTILTSPWTTWEKVFVFWPRRSINNKLILGWINRSERYQYDKSGVVANKKMTEYRWATNKEVFIEKLKNG